MPNDFRAGSSAGGALMLSGIYMLVRHYRSARS